MVQAYRRESRWARQRRLRRMKEGRLTAEVDKSCMSRTGVVRPSHAWHVYALAGGLTLGNVVLFVRMWL